MKTKQTNECDVRVVCSECSGSGMLTLVPSEHGMTPLCIDCRSKQDLLATPYETSEPLRCP